MRRNPPLAAIAVLATVLSGPSPAQSPDTHRHQFGGADKWAKVFDDPARDAWQKPHEVITALKLTPDAAVADIGSGTGYFAARLAHFVPKGRVYGVDTEPDMVKYLTERATREGLANLVSLAGTPDDARLPAKVDLILMVDVYHHIAGREKYFRKLQGSLKVGGRIAVIDFREEATMGPPKRERISPERVRSELAQAGYALAEEHAFLPNQYFLVFRTAER
ncbi:MAG TPA: class I SAM-dependent methyltransferase [Burkholderiales bacterium]|nr:class I SAM-dependent methyltransferase [Burkholderiales bacterium]